MVLDVITYANRAEIRNGLERIGLVNSEGRPWLNLPKIDKVVVHMDKSYHTLSVVRLCSQEDVELFHSVIDQGFIESLGVVVNGEYVFFDKVKQDKYERLLQVGAHTKWVATRNEQGLVILDENQDTIKIPHRPYMIGLFA